jgi:putative adenylate-forming enzyme
MISTLLASWLDTRRAMAMDAAALERRRLRLWARLQPALARTPAFQKLTGMALRDYAITLPDEMRKNYGCYNSLGLSDAALRDAAGRAEAGAPASPRGISAGYSTGTSGMRGLFVTDAVERARYQGQSLATLLPPSALLTGARIALVLRANNALYSEVGRGRLRFAYFPLQGAADATAKALAAFAPDILVAPSHLLSEMARQGNRLPGLKRCFFGAEPMGGGEREWIADRLGVRPDPIYQATEGFLGAACRFGLLHLNDHLMEIELVAVKGTTGFQPVVTDLRRTSQPIVRVQLDDFLEADERPCPCGFAGRTILPVEGRIGDLWRFPGRTITPREATEVVERIVGPDVVWKAEASSAGVRLTLQESRQAADCGAALAARLQLPVPLEITHAPVGPDFPKRRRLRWYAP